MNKLNQVSNEVGKTSAGEELLLVRLDKQIIGTT